MLGHQGHANLLDDGSHPGRTGAPNSMSGNARGGAHALDTLPLHELEQLLTDDSAFKRFAAAWVHDCPAAQTLAQLQDRNRELAQRNLDMQGSLEEARTHVAIVRNSEFAAMRNVFQGLQQRQAAVLEVLAPNVLLQALRDEVDRVDEASGELQVALQSGQLTAEQFSEQYASQRAKFHALDLKRQVAEQSMQ